MQLDIVIRKKSSKKVTLLEEWVSEKEMREELKWSPSFGYKTTHQNEESLEDHDVLSCSYMFCHPMIFHSYIIRIHTKVEDPRGKEVVWSQTWDTRSVTTLYVAQPFAFAFRTMDGVFQLIYIIQHLFPLDQISVWFSFLYIKVKLLRRSGRVLCYCERIWIPWRTGRTRGNQNQKSQVEGPYIFFSHISLWNRFSEYIDLTAIPFLQTN